MDEFILRAALAAMLMALAAGPLGCLIVWRRMAYFGDATAHAAILGVALSLMFSVSTYAGVLVVALAMAGAVARLGQQGQTQDALLGVFAHASLALGLVAMALVPGARSDLSAYLFGDILTVSRSDVVIIILGALAVLALMWWRWQRLLLATLHRDLALASGVDPGREQLVLNLALAVVVAVSIQIVGALLITAFLIIPAATARNIARSPEGMAAGASLLGVLASLVGLWASFAFDTPTGPTIVSVAALYFALSVGWQLVRRAG